MALIKVVVFLLVPFLGLAQPNQLVFELNRVVDFGLRHSDQLNFDGLLGFIIAEAQLVQVLKSQQNKQFEFLLWKLEEINRRVVPNLPKTPRKMIVLQKYLLQPQSWISGENFTHNTLENLGVYSDWSVDDIIKDKSAWYKGVPSDYCLMEILDKDCYVSGFCNEMMLAPRIDKGYLLSHRLFYLQIIRAKRCVYNRRKFHQLTRNFCSLMLKEIRTNQRLGYPARDIALEQMVLCGIEGYSEFLQQHFKKKVVDWQNEFGCYKSREESNAKRSSNVIAFGCSDHTTGLGAAALALHLRFDLQTTF